MDRDLRKYFVQTNRLLDANMQVKIKYENPFSVDTVQAFGQQQIWIQHLTHRIVDIGFCTCEFGE